jgi:hypothetical protein
MYKFHFRGGDFVGIVIPGVIFLANLVMIFRSQLPPSFQKGKAFSLGENGLWFLFFIIFAYVIGVVLRLLKPDFPTKWSDIIRIVERCSEKGWLIISRWATKNSNKAKRKLNSQQTQDYQDRFESQISEIDSRILGLHESFPFFRYFLERVAPNGMSEVSMHFRKNFNDLLNDVPGKPDLSPVDTSDNPIRLYLDPPKGIQKPDRKLIVRFIFLSLISLLPVLVFLIADWLHLKGVYSVNAFNRHPEVFFFIITVVTWLLFAIAKCLLGVSASWKVKNNSTGSQSNTIDHSSNMTIKTDARPMDCKHFLNYCKLVVMKKSQILSEEILFAEGFSRMVCGAFYACFYSLVVLALYKIVVFHSFFIALNHFRQNIGFDTILFALNAVLLFIITWGVRHVRVKEAITVFLSFGIVMTDKTP